MRIVSVRKSLIRWIVSGSAIAAEKNYDRERALLPEHRVDRIRVYGDPPFVTDIVEALSQLRHAYPFGHSLVQRYIRAIVQSSTKPEKSGGIGVVYRKANAEGRLGVDPNRFAAALVREAIALRKFTGFYMWRSPRSELLSLKRELRAMELLHCERKYFHHVWNEILKRERLIKSQRSKEANSRGGMGSD